MPRRDATGLELTAASDAAVTAWDAFLDAYAAFQPTIPDRLKALLEADGTMPLAHAVRAALMMLAGKGELLPVARSSAAEAERLAAGATRREQLHAEAVRRWADDDVTGATRCWELILALEPRDLLALKLAQFAHFYAGDTRAMQRSVDQVADAWDASVPRFGRYLGVRAFALEEQGDLAGAEAAGREAVGHAPDDAWAIHAVAHCLETRGAAAEGCAWLDATADDWAGAGTMDGHLRWHRAIFALEHESPEAVLGAFDDDIQMRGSEEYLDLCNDVALLQRLELRGLDVGDRWSAIADRLEVRARDRMLPFCDVHWALGLAAAGRDTALDALLDGMREAAVAERSDADAWRNPAVPVAEGLAAFRHGDCRRAFERLWIARDRLHLLGGSHAQRDLFEQVLAAATAGAGETGVAARLLAERRRLRPQERPWLTIAA